MIRRSRCLSLILSLILLGLLASGCDQRKGEPEASIISGAVVLAEDPASGLAGVSLFIIDETSAQVVTDAAGSFEAAASSGAEMIPGRPVTVLSRKSGSRRRPGVEICGLTLGRA